VIFVGGQILNVMCTIDHGILAKGHVMISVVLFHLDHKTTLRTTMLILFHQIVLGNNYLSMTAHKNPDFRWYFDLPYVFVRDRVWPLIMPRYIDLTINLLVVVRFYLEICLS
jgi:hypothetical protein